MHAVLLSIATLTAAPSAVAAPLQPDMQPERTVLWQSADGWTGELRHYPGPGEPVLLVHGMGANHYNWDFRREISLAAALQDAGWDVWIPGLRGDPRSIPPQDSSGKNYDFDDHALWDMPAIVRTVLAHTGAEQLYWVGHSMGGMLLYTALADYPERVAAGVTLGSPVRFDPNSRMARRVRRLAPLTAGKGRIPSPALAKLGAPLGKALPTLEVVANKDQVDPPMLRGLLHHALVPVSRELARQGVGWIRTGELTRRDGETPWLQDPDNPVPVLVVAGDQDQLAPPDAAFPACDVLSECQTLLAGPQSGMDAAYGHVDLVLGTNARDEIYPLVLDWLAEQSRAMADADSSDP